MYNIDCRALKNKYEVEELLKLFLRTDEYTLWDEPFESRSGDVTVTIPEQEDKNAVKRMLFDMLKEDKKTAPLWGILTGVRPVKLAMDYLDQGLSYRETAQKFAENYYVSPEKIKLLLDICRVQKEVMTAPDPKSVGLYIGIPFCPTRCVYCSFTSNQAKEGQIAAYMAALHREIRFVGERMREQDQFAESIYIGGGTPTTLEPDQLHQLLTLVCEEFVQSGKTAEFTVEAGRPDTITEEKLKVIRDCGVERISINPQSMKEKTLELIGRAHTPDQIEKAFAMADKAGISVVNADLIAGLPEESPEDFSRTLDAVLGLNPANITVHTLALKRASKLRELDSEYHYKQGAVVSKMLDCCSQIMESSGYRPYYMYRQKQMSGNFENVGYAKPKTENIYNIRIMEEKQSIVALGAGGISKAYFPEENRLERIPNVSNYEIYIDRLSEMLDRKDKGGIFK